LILLINQLFNHRPLTIGYYKLQAEMVQSVSDRLQAGHCGVISSTDTEIHTTSGSVLGSMHPFSSADGSFSSWKQQEDGSHTNIHPVPRCWRRL